MWPILNPKWECKCELVVVIKSVGVVHCSEMLCMINIKNIDGGEWSWNPETEM